CSSYFHYCLLPSPVSYTSFPYTTLFRSFVPDENPTGDHRRVFALPRGWTSGRVLLRLDGAESCARVWLNEQWIGTTQGSRLSQEDRKSTRLNSSHVSISYAVFCL